MKIVIAAEIFAPDAGGPATFVARLQPRLQAAGKDVKIITYADQAENSENLIKINRKQNVLFRYWQYFIALKKLSKDADLIFAQGPTAAGLPAILVKKLLGTKVIIKVVGDVAWERCFNGGKVKDLIDDFQHQHYGIMVELQKKIRSFTVRNADLVITPSQYLKSIVVGWGAKPDKVKVILNSFETHANSLAKEISKQELNLSGKIILSVGRLAPWKGFATLINLMPKLLEVDKDLKLVIVGDGPEMANLQELVNKKPLAQNVILTGRKKQEEMGAYYSAADIFILNTGYEGLSHTLLEALSYNLPVITTNIGGNPEVIKDNVNGLLVEYENSEQIFSAIKKILDNPELAGNFVKNGQEALSQFSFNKMIEEYLSVL